MKVFLIWMCLLVVDFMFLDFQDQYNRAERQSIRLKYIAEEAAAAAAQFYDYQEYALGRKVFNQAEGIRAAEAVIKNNLFLDNDFMPAENSYWTEQITYTIEFFDDSNTTYPYLYEHASSYFTLAIGDPTVIVTINAGKPRFPVYITSNPPDIFRTAAHEWKQR